MASQPNLVNQVIMQLDNDNVSFDANNFDLMAQQKGSELQHYASLPCPVATFDQGDVRSAHMSSCQCGGTGRIYFLKGIIQGILTQVNKSTNFYAGGTIDHSSVYIILPRWYKDTQIPILCAAYDRLVPVCTEGSLNVVYWESTQISQSGVDHLTYPAKFVEYLVDASGKSYIQDADFYLDKQGAIVWKGQNRPTWSQYQNSGAVYSVRYYIEAAWIVSSVMHDVRTIKTADPVTGEAAYVKYPIFLQAQKEINFLANRKNLQPNNLADHFVAESY